MNGSLECTNLYGIFRDLSHSVFKQNSQVFPCSVVGINILGKFYESLHKLGKDPFLDKDPAGGEADLPLVGKGGADHGGQTLVHVHIIEHYPSILPS